MNARKLCNKIARQFGFWGRMSRADRQRWAQADTRAAVGDVVADWLMGTVESQVGYVPDMGPEPETQELIPLLARLNRLGLVTYSSQPGSTDNRCCHEETFYQRAAVELFTDEAGAEDLRMMFHNDPDVMVIVKKVDHGNEEDRGCSCHEGAGDGITVTVVTEGTHEPGLHDDFNEERTWFGSTLTAHQIVDMWEGIGPNAMEELLGSWSVTIIDTVWGRNDKIWPVLTNYARAAENAQLMHSFSDVLGKAGWFWPHPSSGKSVMIVLDEAAQFYGVDLKGGPELSAWHELPEHPAG